MTLMSYNSFHKMGFYNLLKRIDFVSCHYRAIIKIFYNFVARVLALSSGIDYLQPAIGGRGREVSYYM